MTGGPLLFTTGGGAINPYPMPHADPDDIAQTYWNLYTRRSQPEHVIAGR